MPLLPLHPSLKLKLSNVPRHININKEFTLKIDSLCSYELTDKTIYITAQSIPPSRQICRAFIKM